MQLATADTKVFLFIQQYARQSAFFRPRHSGSLSISFFDTLALTLVRFYVSIKIKQIRRPQMTRCIRDISSGIETRPLSPFSQFKIVVSVTLRPTSAVRNKIAGLREKAKSGMQMQMKATFLSKTEHLPGSISHQFVCLILFHRSSDRGKGERET